MPTLNTERKPFSPGRFWGAVLASAFSASFISFLLIALGGGSGYLLFFIATLISPGIFLWGLLNFGLFGQKIAIFEKGYDLFVFPGLFNLIWYWIVWNGVYAFRRRKRVDKFDLKYAQANLQASGLDEPGTDEDSRD